MPRTNSGTKRKYYMRYLAHYTKRNNALIALGTLFVLGVILGVLVYNNAGDETLLLVERMQNDTIAARLEGGLGDNFAAALSSAAVFLGILFISGFCAIAQPAIVLMPFIRGLGFGIMSASLYMHHGTSALAFVGVLILPGMLISTMALLICAVQALKLSGTFFSSVLCKPKNEESYSVKLYLMRFILCAGICVLAAFLEAVLYITFANSLVLG